MKNHHHHHHKQQQKQQQQQQKHKQTTENQQNPHSTDKCLHSKKSQYEELLKTEREARGHDDKNKKHKRKYESLTEIRTTRREQQTPPPIVRFSFRHRSIHHRHPMEKEKHNLVKQKSPFIRFENKIRRGFKPQQTNQQTPNGSNLSITVNHFALTDTPFLLPPPKKK